MPYNLTEFIQKSYKRSADSTENKLQLHKDITTSREIWKGP